MRFFAIVCVLALSCFGADKRKNPGVEKIVSGISESRMEATLKKLEAFGTRYVMSDQDHPTKGIGAAKRWLHDELKSYSPRLQVEYDVFTLKKGSGRNAILHDVELANVVAILPGTISKDRCVLVTAHYDSLARARGRRNFEQRVASMVKRGVEENEAKKYLLFFPPDETFDSGEPEAMAAEPLAPGVTDDGSGTAAVLELARVMSQFEFDKTLVFVLFSAEEVGLEGSKAYVAKAKEKKMGIEAVLNNDIIGSDVAGNGHTEKRVVRIFGDGPEDSPHRALMRYAKDVGERYVPTMKADMIFRGDRFARGGDHSSFSVAGFPAVRFTSAAENYEHQHTPTDTFTNTSVPYATRVARMNAAIAATLALAPAPPNVTWTFKSGPNKGSRQPMLTRGASGYDAVLRWEKGEESDLAGYAIVTRATTAPNWEREIYVGNVTEYRFPNLSIDDIVLGVKAVDHDGNQSLVSAYLQRRIVTSPAPTQPAVTQ